MIKSVLLYVKEEYKAFLCFIKGYKGFIMQEKEMKIAELAQVWGVSVPAVWNRIKKLDLETFIKRSETNKDITYVRISDERINEYANNNVYNVNNVVNNGYYEDMLINNNLNNNLKSQEASLKADIQNGLLTELINLNKGYNEELKSVYETFNNRLERLNDELITFKSKVPLLEDKASREGLYIKENNDLKNELKAACKLNKVLITFLTILSMIIICAATYFITLHNVNNNIVYNIYKCYKTIV